MDGRKNLYLGVLLAPYRLDYYNYLHDHMNCEIYFQLRSFDGQLFSTEELERKCTFVPHYLRIRHLGRDRQIVTNLKKVIKLCNPEVIVVPEFSVLAIQVILIKKIFGYKYKIVSQCDDSYDMLEHKGFSRLHGLSRLICMPYLDNLILLDKRAQEWYQARYHKGIFMPLIIDETKQDDSVKREAKNRAEELKSQYGLDSVKTILFVGRLIEVKNPYRLMDACKRLSFPYKLVFVGDGILRQDLEQYADKINANVIFAGRQNGVNLLAWYFAADAFVLPSLLEPFGAVTNEALLCGCNCCISQLAGSACLIDEGENGFICNPQSVEDIAEKITKTCGLPTSESRESKMHYKFEECMNTMIEEMKPLFRVFHVVTRLDLGGGERVAFNIAEAKSKGIESHVVEVVRAESEFSDKIKEELKSYGIKYHTSPVKNNKLAILLFPFWFLFTYLRYCPDVVHTHTEIPDLSMYLFRKISWLFFWIRPKYVRTIHNTQLWNEWKFIGKLVESFYIKHHCNVSISRAVSEMYAKEYGQIDVPLIYNGLPEVEQKPFEHLVEGKKNILFAGRLEPQKGIDTLIAVVKSLKDNPDLHFHIVGNGSQGDKLKEALQGQTNVSMYDKVYGLAHYLGSFDYLFMPSVHEGLVLTCIEASLAHTPAIVNWCAGIDETLPEDWPLRVQGNNVNAFVEIFTTTIFNIDYASLSDKAYQYAKQKFSLENMQKDYAEIYRK